MSGKRAQSNPPPTPRNTVAPSISTPIVSTSNNNNGDEQNLQMINQTLNEKISSLEDLIKSLTSNRAMPESSSSSSASSSSSSAAPEPVPAIAEAPMVILPAAIVESRSVPRKNYNTTSPSVTAMFNSNRIDSTSKDSFVKISMVRGALSTAGLRNLLDGHRLKPQVTPNNIYGFSERSITTSRVIDEVTGAISEIEIMLEEDDTFYYSYDCGRLYQAVIEIFGKSLHYLVPIEIEANDGRKIYTKIMEHLNGQRGRDADIARENFTKYAMNESLTFKQEHAKFEDVFKTLEHAQRKLIPESEKIQFLTKRLMKDSRVGLKDVMVQSRCNDYSYDKTIELLTKINCEMADGDQTVKLANISYPSRPINKDYHNNSNKYNNSNNNNQSVSKGFCYNWNETGACQFGQSCRFDHKKDPNHVTREPREPPNDKSNNKSTDTSSSQPITKNNRTPHPYGSGPYRGKYNNKFKSNKMNTLSTVDESASLKHISVTTPNTNSVPSTSNAFISWGNLSSKPFEPQNEIHEFENMKMITDHQLLSSDVESNSTSSSTALPYSHSRVGALNSRSKTLIAVQYVQMHHSRRHHGSDMTYAEQIHSMPRLSQLRYFERTLVYLNYPENVEYEAESGHTVSSYTGFGWNPRCPITANILESIRNPSGSTMEMIYRINEIFLEANVCHAIAIRRRSRDHSGSFAEARYMDFRHKWYPQGTPGHYQSTVKDMNEYLFTIKRIREESEKSYRDADGNVHFAEATVQVLLWGITFDFMSHATSRYDTNKEKGMTIEDSRLEFIAELLSIPARSFTFRKLKRVFLEIAGLSKLTPLHSDDDVISDVDSDVQSSDESESESDTEYPQNHVNSHKRFKRMSVYPTACKSLSTQRKYIYESADAIKFEKNK